MTCLVIFYSRTGITRKVAGDISSALRCDSEEIVDMKDRGGAYGYAVAGHDALRGRLTDIKPVARDAARYDMVLLGTPVWAFTMAPALRTYIVQNKGKIRNVAFFCTQGGSGGQRTLRHMEELVGRRPCAVLELRTQEVKTGMHLSKVQDFVNRITGER